LLLLLWGKAEKALFNITPTGVSYWRLSRRMIMKGKRFYGDIRETDAIVFEKYRRFILFPQTQEITVRADLISDEDEMESSILAELEKYNPADFFENRDYVRQGGKVYLIPGSAQVFFLGGRVLLENAQQHVKLDNYDGCVFVFRNEDRTMMAELCVEKLSTLMNFYHNVRSIFVDPEWTSDETAVKILTIKEYKVLLDRMQDL
jgi:hypothetical protein